jgi:peptidoglycan hydrolase-like protein with peptidoglycan-binding domain
MALSSARLRDNDRLQAAAGSGSQALGKGERDKEAVALLQSCLMELGFEFKRSLKPSGLPDGIFGNETDEVLRSFQRKSNLKADGLAGPKTLGRIDAVYVALSQADTVKLNAELRLPQGPWKLT